MYKYITCPIWYHFLKSILFYSNAFCIESAHYVFEQMDRRIYKFMKEIFLCVYVYIYQSG